MQGLYALDAADGQADHPRAVRRFSGNKIHSVEESTDNNGFPTGHARACSSSVAVWIISHSCFRAAVRIY